MAENTGMTSIPQAESVPERKYRVSAVWIIPIVAALAGAGIAVQRYLSEGPEIRITFQTGEGLEAGKTVVKYKEVEIGTVTKVNLTDNHARVLVTAKMEKSVEGMLDNDARFWVVRPRVTLSGVSGLGTLFSGSYIGFEPGKSREKRRAFVGREIPPAVTRDRPGREFVLRSDTLGSIGIGTPVYFRRLAVGDVVAFDLEQGGHSVEVRIFVNAPYDRFVTSDTRFWEASGIDVSAGSEGISVRTESLTALLVGGIAFETPPSGPAAEAGPNTAFTLFRDRKAALAPAQKEVLRYVIRTRESLRGLSVGAPVQFLGMPIGEVVGVGLEFNRETQDLRPRVEIQTFTYQVADQMATKESQAIQKSLTPETRRDLMQKMVVEKGLRAQLRTGSLLSGQLYVAFDYFPDAPKARIDWAKDPPEFPVVPGRMTEIEEKIRSIVAKLDNVPVEEIGSGVKKAVGSLDNALQSATRTMNRVEGETLPEAKKTLATLERTLARFDGEVVPELKRTLEDLRRAIVSAERVLANTDNAILGPDAPVQQELRDAMREVTRAARAVRTLADSLERNPEALIRGKTQEKP